ncbi:glycosyltransferase [Cyclobacterium qasimii]|uniref:Glycosyltransferase n=2 Tax=Cyclobacterium qasimii TaxID=1350429 RepID=S7VG87_9BACT|nr:glycosyltransferase [Cyclobacterium qasimii]EPR69036.1 Glycosyltransferase [Cyclobacterium qasimii M12-11B]GEO24201.1 glycosyl transferase [Cyclobacterium qasimii]
MRFSVIIPVYNRPEELQNLLESLCLQTFSDFEVVVIEDGSEHPSEAIVRGFYDRINVNYHFQENTGQGFARNKGIELAKGDYFVFFDSDCVIPADYFKILNAVLETKKLDAHGGPDDAGESFSPWQKAMNFSMTSFLTTGGIRGKMKNPAKYQARGYNMGFSREVYQRVGGFIHPNMAEDIELSIRIKKAGFRLELVSEAFVYHHRKNDFLSFIRQSHQFGRNRVFITKFHKDALKLVHLLPVVFLIGLLLLPFALFIYAPLGAAIAVGYFLWTVAVLLSAAGSIQSRFLAVLTSYGQLIAYGTGVLREGHSSLLGLLGGKK